MICGLLISQLGFATTEGNFQSAVSGTVTDADGVPLPGASVVVKGTTTGAQTDFDGNYSITASSDATLVFSYVGYASKEIAVNGQSTINVSLSEDLNELDEVVVLGYSTQTRGDLTGSVASVDVGEATKVPVVSVGEALQGRVTGVTVTTPGQPGDAPVIRVRGYGTTNVNGPLFIIDGVQTQDASILNSINPADIDQYNVLKDGAAAIYGARAANGVIIVTTKSGGYNMEKATLSVDTYTGFSKVGDLPGLLTAQQHGDMIFQSQSNSGVTPDHPQYGNGSNAVVPTQLQGVPVAATVQPGGTDWLDEIFRTAPTQSINVSLQNGTESGKSFLSLGFLNRDGVQEFTGYKRGIVRANTEFKIGKRVKIGEHMGVSFSETRAGNQVGTALRTSPLIPVYDDAGAFAGSYTAAAGLGNTENPYAILSRAQDNYRTELRVFGDVYASVDILDGLQFKTSLGVDVKAFDGRFFNPKNPEHSEARSTNTLTEEDYNRYEWVWSNTLSYNKTFGDHNVNAVVGVEALETRQKGKNISRNDYLFEDPNFYLLSNGTAPPTIGFAYDNSSSLYSIFGTANYSYKSRYLFTATVRRDKTSRFAEGNQVGVFPSFSAGWVASEEDFFNVDFINRLKIKASWGQLGNQELPVANPYLNISEISESGSFYPFDGASPTTGAQLSAVGNPDIKWETSETKNIGFEMDMLDSRLSLGFEYYQIDTEDLISQDNSLISTTAIDAAAPYVNFGSMRNKGFDLSIGYIDQTDSGFSYGVTANISHYKNEVTELITDFYTGDSFRQGAVTRTEVGRPISSFYGRVVEGIFQSDAEVSAHATQAGAAPGRLKYKDVNNDGVINDEDRDYIGSPHPDFTYGLNLTAGYKNFDLSAFFTGSSGNDIYYHQRIYTEFPTFFNLNRTTAVLDAWSTSNTGGSVPALSTSVVNEETNPNSYFVEDGSYFRLKNLQLGYNLPSEITEKMGMSNFRVYLQGTNLFTITDYSGMDPEVGARNARTIGVDTGTYPISKIYTLGVNLKF
ncbi:SusC/RagA family TonB-linked outer membrane protein [Sediminicola luteus]|uniref:SusC/RagA family TonB-linked outer membrane protein n=2 Tax=Sediminicola luteus TaxID=319238 RepID=A0A2A4G2B3_9FLAO|nr:SusC/RagA family TonB-linked outer membrane protein [Sediminicola luteus]